MASQPRLLTDEEMQAFIVNGFVSLQTDFPAQFHAEICRQATDIFDRTGNPYNDIYPLIPQLGDVFGHPMVHGALTSILGPNYIMHPHRHCHLTPPGKQPQNYHKDSYEEDENVHHHRTRWAMAFYYPQDVPVELGPTAVRPATQYYNTQSQAEEESERLLVGGAGTITLVHYDLWHRASANFSNRGRFMMKFLFCRMEEPQSPSWASSGAPWRTTSGATEPRHQHEGLWRHLWDWHCGHPGSQASQNAMGERTINDWVHALYDKAEAVRLDAGYALG
ncbi:MAG TPA: phytanoyl-CoA dioxygenase family protein, partial [Caldilineaceae bacterium]|nr:phytanoyl-CoA dioxygenase family protein [Caldilineaceae bacterium]